uniref:Uncharacterized protein n=1 Tax=Sus scrofa TaxID=9823 RepID=A0A8D1KWF2_PIG
MTRTTARRMMMIRMATRRSSLTGHWLPYTTSLKVVITVVPNSQTWTLAITKRPTDNNCWRGCREKGTLLHCWWECKLIQPLWNTVWRFLRKLNIDLPYDAEIPLLGIYLDKTFIQKDTCTHMFIEAYSQQTRYGNILNVHQ